MEKEEEKIIGSQKDSDNFIRKMNNFKIGLANWLSFQQDIIDIDQQIYLIESVIEDLREEQFRQEAKLNK